MKFFSTIVLCSFTLCLNGFAEPAPLAKEDAEKVIQILSNANPGQFQKSSTSTISDLTCSYYVVPSKPSDCRGEVEEAPVLVTGQDAMQLYGILSTRTSGYEYDGADKVSVAQLKCNIQTSSCEVKLSNP